MIRNKYILTFLATLIGISAYAVDNDFSGLSSSGSIAISDNGSISSDDQQALDAPFTSTRTYKSFNDVVGVLSSLGIKGVVQSQSSTTIPSQGIAISTSGSIRDYLNRVSNQFGYSWSWNSDTNQVTFKAINPVTTQSTTTASPTQTQNKTIVVIPPKNQESSTNKNPSNPVLAKTTILTSDNSNTYNYSRANKVWTLDSKDKTVRVGMSRWASEAGWQLVWRADYDMPIEASVSIPGSFEFAVNEICRASQYTGKQLIAEMHDKNKVIVIYTPNGK